MTSNLKIISLCTFILCSSLLCCCKINEKNMCFSFEKIQNHYYKELKREKACSFDPFYINKDFYQNLEVQLNQMIKESDCCSVYIRSSVENAVCEVAVLFNKNEEIYFYLWDNNGLQKTKVIHDSTILEILKEIPKHTTTIDKTDLMITDGVSEYLIKKIKKKTFYYANHESIVDYDYKSIINLFDKEKYF